ncbi:MAG: acyl-CoA dehydrogenase family protein [Chloroflexi bacterium]|nr:acyl-CoA dehydrogenase family protein [Chloroflexota bacterium]
MDWDDSELQREFRGEVRAFIEERLPDYYRRRALEIDAAGENDWQADVAIGEPDAQSAAREWAAALAEHGWAAPHWPTEYGGAGLTSIEQFIFNSEMASTGAPQVGGSGLRLLGPTVLVHGTEEQKQQLLAPTLRGDMFWAQGFSEPGAGSDLASLQTRAVRDGDEYLINGQKMWTSSAHKANWIFGMFRTDPDAPKHRGISFFVMSMDTPGISVRPIVSMGFRHATNETFYEDVRVPANQMIGEENRGWYVGMTLLDYERSGIGGAIGNRQFIERLIEYADTPAGRAMREHGGLARERADLAEHYIASEVMFNFSMRVASMQAAGMLPNYEASMGKMFFTELKQRIARTGIKVFGLYSNLWDGDDAHAPAGAEATQVYVHSVVQTIAGGSSEIQRNIIATRGLGLPRG